MSNVICYTYEADHHCKTCAMERFTQMTETDCNGAVDNDGNPIGIDYTYHDIIEISKAWHDMEFTEAQEDMICEQWFKFLAFKLVQMCQYYDTPLSA